MPKISLIFRLFFSLSIIVGSKVDLLSQDLHFSQRAASFSFLNDNFVLNDDEKLALYSIYREQWGVLGNPFTTAAIGGVMPITEIRSVKLKLGFQVMNDESGDAILRNSQLFLNVIGEYVYQKHTFALSLGNGYVFRSFDASALSFPSQFDRNTGGFNSNLPNQEVLGNNQRNYLKVNLAPYWKYEVSKTLTTHLGLSFRQINQPDVSFLNAEDQLGTSVGLQFSADFYLKPKMTLKPSLSYFNLQNASETIIGSAIEVFQNSNSKLISIEPFLLSRLGVSRTFDALILGSYVQWSTFKVGLSYDVNVSSLSVATNNQGAFEISLRYSIEKRRITHKRIACERL